VSRVGAGRRRPDIRAGGLAPVRAPGGRDRGRRADRLCWLPSADAAGYPVSWEEGLAVVRDMNRDAAHGRSDWRMPNRRELRSLLSHGAKNPALPANHPFTDVFSGRYWTSSSFAGMPRHAWYVHLEGARVFYERKDRYCLLWPDCGHSSVHAATGQNRCFDAAGREIPCAGSGQDGESQSGVPWPHPRFVPDATPDMALDRLTGLVWRTRPVGPGQDQGNATDPLDWGQALRAVADLAAREKRPWRLPDVNELESLTDLSRAFPALPAGIPFSSPPRVPGPRPPVFSTRPGPMSCTRARGPSASDSRATRSFQPGRYCVRPVTERCRPFFSFPVRSRSGMIASFMVHA
jgi:hypothetical protein